MSVLSRLWPPQELIIEADAKLFKGFFEPLKTFLAHKGGKPDTSLCSDDC